MSFNYVNLVTIFVDNIGRAAWYMMYELYIQT